MLVWETLLRHITCTNIPESANALIKRGVNFQQNEISDFCREMAILLCRQKEDVDSAVIN